MLFCAVIITAFSTVCKKLIPLSLHHRSADLPQAHLRNVAGGNAEGVDRAGRVKFIDMGKLVGGEIIVCPQAKSREQHIGYADLQRVPIEHLQTEIVQFLQQAVLPTVTEVLQVVCDIVCHGVVAGGAHGVHKIFFFGQVTEGGFQRFNDFWLKSWLHRPNRQRAGKAGRMSVRNVKIELQAVLPVIAENRDALCTAIHPASKPSIPSFHFKNCSGIRALGINQDLFIKAAFVVIAGSTQKACPASIAASDILHGLIIQLCDELKFRRQVFSPPFAWHEKVALA